MNMKSILGKGFVLGIVTMFVFVAVNIPVPAQKTTVTRSLFSRGDFGLQSIVSIFWDSNQTSAPLDPLGTPRTIILNVTYNSVQTYFFGRIILFFCQMTHKSIFVNLDLAGLPDWCTASLTNPHIQFFITGSPSSQLTTLILAVDEHAPAFEPFGITIKAKVDTMMGPFGLLPFIKGCDVTNTIYFSAGYLPIIEVAPESSIIETTPGSTVIDPITITNLGNGKTLVDSYITGVPPNWLVILDPQQLVVDINESGVTNLSIAVPLNYYGIETIELSFTPKFYDDPLYQGAPINVYIRVEVRSNV